MEQIIEFPMVQSIIFDSPMSSFNGFCICYQHDVNPYGYGPYGFDTDKAVQLLKQLLPPLVYWDSEREKLVGSESFYMPGIYFVKNQEYVRKLESELLIYEKNKKKYALMQSYKKAVPVNSEYAKPSIISSFSERLASASFASELLADGCVFFIVNYFYIDHGRVLVFFDMAMREKIKSLASHAGINYIKIGSYDDLKPW